MSQIVVCDPPCGGVVEIWSPCGGVVVCPLVVVVVWWLLYQQEAQTSLTIEQRDSEPNSSITQNLLPAEEGKGPVQLG